jgi:hypothetical protein
MTLRSIGAAVGAALLSLSAAPTLAGYTATRITNSGSAWNTLTDTQLGIVGYTIESFEQTTLASGLQIGVTSVGGTRPLSSTLANTFNPATNDPFGSAFVGGTWDGTRALINTPTNVPGPYSGQGQSPWGTVTFQFTGGAQSVGFSLQQPEYEIDVSINGIARGTLSSLTGVNATGSGRIGYFLFNGTGGDLINTLTLANRGVQGEFDGWAIDRLAFSLAPQTGVIPVPAALPLFVSGLGLIGWLMRRRA